MLREFHMLLNKLYSTHQVLFYNHTFRKYNIPLLHSIIHGTLMTGETETEEASSELDINGERFEVDAKQHLN